MRTPRQLGSRNICRCLWLESDCNTRLRQRGSNWEFLLPPLWPRRLGPEVDFPPTGIELQFTELSSGLTLESHTGADVNDVRISMS
jgi:hypothetical protein